MKRLWKILLSLSLILMFVPAIAFAEEDLGKPLSISFKAAVTPQYYEGSTDQYIYVDEPGNSLTVNYEKASKEYKYVRYNETADGWSNGWFLNGDVSSEDSIWFETSLENGKVIISCEVWDENAEDYKYLKCSVDAKPYPYPVSLSYSGAELTYYAGYDDIEGFYTEGNKITVKNQNGTTDEYICKQFTDEYGDTVNRYFLDGKVEKNEDSDSYNYKYFELEIPDEGIKSGTTEIKFSCSEWYDTEEKVATGKLDVKEKKIPYPKSVKFVPAKGFTAKGLIGETWLGSEVLGGKGNKFVVTFSDGSKKEYVAVLRDYGDGDKHYEFAYSTPGNDDELYAYPEITLKKGLKKGTNTVKGTLSMWVPDKEKDYSLPFSVKIKASKYFAYAVHYVYTVTGKTITPDVRVLVANDKGKMVKLSSSKYTYKAKKGKKIGSYSFKIKIKNKADQKKYGKTITCTYSIVPKAPTGVTAKAGSKKLTVKWKKQSGVDGYNVLISTSKSFRTLAGDSGKISKNKTSYTFKNLKKGKKYYACVMSIKNGVYSIYSKKVAKVVK